VLINITKQIKILFYLYKAMKLTKGKLSKIQNKKKQSLKRYKKGRKTHKSKTFRKRKHLNLHNTSLKKYKGGDGETTEAKPAAGEVEPIQQEPLTQPSEEAAQPLQEETVQPLKKETVQPLEEETAQPLKEETVKPLKEESLTTPEDAASQEPISSNPGEGPGSHQELPPPVSEEGSTESEIATNNSDDAVAGSGAESVAGSDAGSSEEAQSEQIVTSVENQPSIAAESLDNLIDYISDKIAKKLKQSSSFGYGSDSGLNKDSFNSVANVNESLAES
jgi:hypothetical protein